jgi:hypothetical protein
LIGFSNTIEIFYNAIVSWVSSRVTFLKFKVFIRCVLGHSRITNLIFKSVG